jgi:hypothetical protein
MTSKEYQALFAKNPPEKLKAEKPKHEKRNPVRKVANTQRYCIGCVDDRNELDKDEKVFIDICLSETGVSVGNLTLMVNKEHAQPFKDRIENLAKLLIKDL